MKKIAIFLTGLGGGGAERVMVNLANGFASREFEVDLLLVKREGVYLSALSSRVNSIDLGTRKLAASWPKLAAYLRKVQPEILLTALEDTNVVAILARLMARRLGPLKTRLIVTVHNNLTQEGLGGQGLKRRLVPYTLKWIYPFADSVVAVSKGVAADLVTLGVRSHRVHVIYNPILTPDFGRLASAGLPNGQAENWLLQKEMPVILSVGRLKPQKDFETLIRAFEQVKKARPASNAGRGQSAGALNALCRRLEVAESVAFVGFASNLLAYMARADLCALSSAWEGFGNVLVEAMGVGTP